MSPRHIDFIDDDYDDDDFDDCCYEGDDDDDEDEEMYNCAIHKAAQERGRRSAPRPRPGHLLPAIYRTLLASSEARVPYLGVWQVTFLFKVRGPAGECGELELVVSTKERSDTAYLCRIFAVAGLVVERPEDLPLACRAIVGRQFFVEILPDGKLHVLQLATTHQVAAPEQAVYSFPGVSDFPYGEEDDDDVDLSDPCAPRFHGCDVAQKAELRLHRYEAERVARESAVKAHKNRHRKA